MAFSIGSFLGPIVAGQILGNTTTTTSWTILCIMSAVLSALCLVPVAIWVGGRSRLWGKGKREKEETEKGEVEIST